MRKVRQLKESILGWGGYKDEQDKIYLEKEVVYMRGCRTTNGDGSISEKIYFINIDGTSTDKCVTITIPSTSTVSNERFFFDKPTQCIVRTAIEESGSGDIYGVLHPNKKIAFDLYDPNTFELLDSHVINAVSSTLDDNSATYVETARKANCSQGMYSFYCNGINNYRTTTNPGRSQHTTVYIYIPRRKRVFEVKIGETKEQYIPVSQNTSDLYNGPRTDDALISVYNESKDPSVFDNVSIDIYMPTYTGGSTAPMTQYYYHFDVNLETNPAIVGCKFTPDYTVVGHPTILSGAILGQTDADNYITPSSPLSFYQNQDQIFFGVYLDLAEEDQKMVLITPADPTVEGTTFYVRSETSESTRYLYFGREYYNPATEERNVFESTAGSIIYDGPGMYYFIHRCTKPSSGGLEEMFYSKYAYPFPSSSGNFNASKPYTRVAYHQVNLITSFEERANNTYKFLSDFPYYALRLADTSYYFSIDSTPYTSQLATLNCFTFNSETTGTTVHTTEIYPNLPLTADYCLLSDGTNITNYAAHASTRIFPNNEFDWQLTEYGRNSKLCAATTGATKVSVVLCQDGQYMCKYAWNKATWATLSSYNWMGLAYGANKFVALGDWGYVSTSSDGVTYSSPSTKCNAGTYIDPDTQVSSTDRWTGLAYNGSVFMALSKHGVCRTSNDGDAWSDLTTIFDVAPEGQLWNALASNGTDWLAISVGDSNATVGYVGISDGSTLLHTYSSSRLLNCQDVIWDGSKYVAITSDGKITTSTTGESWTQQITLPTLTANDDEWRSILYLNGKYYALTSLHKVFSTSDLSNWDADEWVDFYYEGSTANWEKIATNGSSTISAIAFNGSLASTNQNGNVNTYSTWAQGINSGTNWYGLAGSDNLIIAISLTGGVWSYTPENGWQNTNTSLGNIGSNNGWGHLTYANGKFLALAVGWTIDGSTGTVIRYDVYVNTSSDGVTWGTPAKSSVLETHFQVGILFAFNNMFYAMTYDGYLSTSSDGVNWSAYQHVIPSTFRPRRACVKDGYIYIEGNPTDEDSGTLSNDFRFIKSADCINWSNVIYPLDSRSGISTASSYDFVATRDELILQTRSSSSSKMYMSYEQEEDADFSPEYVNMTYFANVLGSYLKATGLQNNMYGYMPIEVLTPGLPEGKWNGNVSYIGGTFKYLVDYSAGEGMSSNGSNNAYHAAISTPVTYIPRLAMAPKIVAHPMLIDTVGQFETVCDQQIVKDYDDPAYALIVESVDPSFQSYGSQTVTYTKQTMHILLLGESVNAVTMHNALTRDAPIIRAFRHSGKKYYISEYKFTTNISDEIANYTVPFITLENGMTELSITDYGYIMLSGLKNGGVYSYPYFIKDYYTNNTANALSYNFYTEGNGKNTITVYDACTGSATTNNLITNEQTYMPLSERSVIVTTCASPSAASLPRYMNLVRGAYSYDSTNLWYKIVPVTTKLDANTNTAYLADNNTSFSTPYSNGSFSIPAVAIADGDLADPVIEIIPEDFYAWSRTENGETYYVFTPSLNAQEVINQVYYMKTPNGEFIKPIKSNSTTVASFQANYITTKAGVQYNRDMDYDYSLNTDTNEFVPVYLKGWDA